MASIKLDGVLKAVRQIRGGAPVAHQKNTAELETVRIPNPERVVLAMHQHIGAPCKPTVKVGDTVSVGQVIGDTDVYVSAPVHASVSGKVVKIAGLTLPNGIITQGVTIESDGEMRLDASLTPPEVTDKQSLAAAARASGLVGLGGAGFPAHVKLNVPADKTVDTLIINAAECEPYITVDYRECIENSWDILSGIYTVKEILGIKKVIIGVEDNKPAAIRVLKDIADRDLHTGNEVRLMVLKSRYPQGAEKMLVESTTGRRIPPGKLPLDVGCLVMNVGSIAFLSRYIKTGKPLVSRNLTVDGPAIQTPKNVRAPIGTSLADIIDFCGGFRKDPEKILKGGPMMGLAVVSTELPTQKSDNAILAFSKDALPQKKEHNCIRCGRCGFACPVSLMPMLILQAAKKEDASQLDKLAVSACMECGSCAYVCPSALPLVQYLRHGKTILAKEATKNG